MEGVSARNGGVGFVREALGCQVPVRVTAPPTRVTGCLWHPAVIRGAQLGWAAESPASVGTVIFHPSGT